jgi:hypothetical protein
MTTTQSFRTIHCPECGGVYAGSYRWGVECRSCGDFREPLEMSSIGSLLQSGEVVRIANGEILIAVTA